MTAQAFRFARPLRSLRPLVTEAISLAHEAGPGIAASFPRGLSDRPGCSPSSRGGNGYGCDHA